MRTDLTAGKSATINSAYSTLSIAPGRDRLILAFVANARAIDPKNPQDNVAAEPILQGNGLTWEKLLSVQVPGRPTRRLTCLRAMGPAPTPDAVTIDFAGQKQGLCAWSLFEYHHADTSGANGSGAVLQARSLVGSGAATAADTLNPLADAAGSIAVGGILVTAGGQAPQSVAPIDQSFEGLRAIHEAYAAGKGAAQFLQTEDRVGGRLVDWSWQGQADFAAILLEVRPEANVVLSDEDVVAIKRNWERSLIFRRDVPNIWGVGLGAKIQGEGVTRKPTGDLAISVIVSRKQPHEQVPEGRRIPPNLQGAVTDVVEMLPAEPQSVLEGGMEIVVKANIGGQDLSTNGTLGCVARTSDVPDSKPPNVLLSCYHVLYNWNKELKRYFGGEGDKVLVTSCSDCCETLIARVGKGNESIDAAIAAIEGGFDVRAHTYHKPITGTLDLRPENWANLSAPTLAALRRIEFQVHKFGQRTGLTHGHVLCVDVKTSDLTLSRKEELARQIVVQSLGREPVFSDEGDSGSVIYDNDWKVIGLLRAGSTERAARDSRRFTLATPIVFVEKLLGIRIATNPPARIWRLPGSSPAPPLTRLQRDLATIGPGAGEILGLYGSHEAEVRALLARRRRFAIAWHRNHGPAMIRALRAVAEDREAALPERFGSGFEARPWAVCTEAICDALAREGSPALVRDVARHRTLAAALGGLAYEEILERLDAFGRGLPPVQRSSEPGPGGEAVR